jgi:hypothetical protein
MTVTAAHKLDSASDLESQRLPRHDYFSDLVRIPITGGGRASCEVIHLKDTVERYRYSLQ